MKAQRIVNAALSRYLASPLYEVELPAWWVKAMEQTKIYRKGIISSYDPEFALPIGKWPTLVHLVRWLKDLEKDPDRYWLSLIGNKGVGKTHLACILGTLWMIKTRTIAKRLPWAAWLNKQRSRIGQSVAGQDVSRIPDVTSAYTVPFLIVDDLSTGRVGATVWSLETLFSIMEARDENRLPTVFISNAPLADVVDEETGKRTFSLYRRQLIAQAARANGNRKTYLDLVEKVCDRFSQGKGSHLTHVTIKSITAESYRVLD